MIQRELGNLKGEADVLIQIGNQFKLQEQYTQAANHYQQSLVIQHEINDRSGQAASLFSLGNVYDSLGQYQQALRKYHQALSILIWSNRPGHSS